MLVFVDLDRTFLKTDVLFEGFLKFISEHPHKIFHLIFWLLKGRLYFKNKILKQARLNLESLPVNTLVFEKLSEFKKNNLPIILITASPQFIADKIKYFYPLFDQAYGSDDKTNLKSHNKVQFIKNNFGNQPFCYFGDSSADLPVWSKAAKSFIIEPSTQLMADIKKLGLKDFQIITSGSKINKFKLLLKQMRPHQWVKNALLFLPLFLAHSLNDYASLIKTFTGFGLFSVMASSVYIFNDLFDLESDRNHHSKKSRPFASCDLDIRFGLYFLSFVVPLILISSAYLSMAYFGVSVIYLVLNFLYTFYLKKVYILDILILSSMYTLRLLAGGALAEISLTEWLLSFSTFFFFSLACIKRYTEIIRSQNKISIDGRGYRSSDQSAIYSIGLTAGFMSILIMSLYLQSPEVRLLYNSPKNLWLIIPTILYWVSRNWFLANRNMIHDDPIVFAIKDKQSWACLALVIFGLFIAL